MKIGYIDKHGNVKKEFYRQGCIYKDTKAFSDKTGVCYIPELCDTMYTYDDFLEEAYGDEDIAKEIFELVDWQSPSTLIQDYLDNGELKICDKCNKLYATYGDDDAICCICNSRGN